MTVVPTMQDPALRASERVRVQPTQIDFDEVLAVAVNMPRGHMDEIKTRWPQRGRLCADAIANLYNDSPATGLAVGYAEFAAPLAVAPIKSRGQKLTRGVANVHSGKQRIGNAIGYLDLRLKDHYGVKSLPFIDAPHGIITLTQPVRLFRTEHGGEVCVIQLHPPVVHNVAPPKGVPGGKTYGRTVRYDLIEKVNHIAEVNLRHNIPTLCIGDFNKMIDRLSGDIFIKRDVQGVVGWGCEPRGKGGVLKGHGIWTDHSGSPWTVARIPYFSELPDFKLPTGRYAI